MTKKSTKKAKITEKASKKKFSQIDLLIEFFKKHPNKDIAHPTIVDWAVNEWKKRTGEVFHDPDRGIRKLYQDVFL